MYLFEIQQLHKVWFYIDNLTVHPLNLPAMHILTIVYVCLSLFHIFTVWLNLHNQHTWQENFIWWFLFFFQRKQKEVQKENEFYVNLIQQALPTELQNQYIEKQKGTYLDIFLFMEDYFKLVTFKLVRTWKINLMLHMHCVLKWWGINTWLCINLMCDLKYTVQLHL